MLIFLLLLVITLVCFWIVFLGGAERVNGLFSFMDLDPVEMLTPAMTPLQVRICTAVIWCVSVVLIAVLAPR